MAKSSVSRSAIGLFCLTTLLAGLGYSQERLSDGVLRWERKTVATFASTWWQSLYDLFGFRPIGAPPFRRSVAFLAGVSDYAHMEDLVYVASDLEKMRKFLLEEAGFDTVYEAKEAIVTRTVIESYMRNKFTRRGNLLDPEDRLFFLFSGHGGDQDGVGYLLFKNAVPGEFGGENALSIRDCQE